MTTFKKTGGWEITPKTGTNDAGEEHYTGDPSVSILTVTVPDPPPEDEDGGADPGGAPGPGGGGGGGGAGGGGGGGTIDEWRKQLEKWQKYIAKKHTSDTPKTDKNKQKKAEDAKKKRKEAEDAKKAAKEAKDAAKNGTGTEKDAKDKEAEAKKKEDAAKKAEKALRQAAGGDPKAQGTTHALTITVTPCDTAASIAKKMQAAAKADGLTVDEEETGGCTVDDVTDIDAIRGPGVQISFHGGLEDFVEQVAPPADPGGGSERGPGQGGGKDDDKQKSIGPGGSSGGDYRNVVDENEIDWVFRLEVEGGSPNDGVGEASIEVATLDRSFDPGSIRLRRANWRYVVGEFQRDVFDVFAERLGMQGIVAVRSDDGLALSGDVAGNRIMNVAVRLWSVPDRHTSTAHWRLYLPRRSSIGEFRAPSPRQTTRTVRGIRPLTSPTQIEPPSPVRISEPLPDMPPIDVHPVVGPVGQPLGVPLPPFDAFRVDVVGMAEKPSFRSRE